MIESLAPSLPDDDSEETPRPGPWWRHAVWVAGITVCAVTLGWATGFFRISPERYGLPSAAPGPLWPYLLFWTAVGLLVAAVLRATAARVPLYAPGRIAGVLTLLGTRLSLGWRPGAPVLAGMAVAALAAAVVWCAIGFRSARAGRRHGTEGAAAEPADGAPSQAQDAAS
ncbi:hypothetical protein M5362_30400 [Streptomyces sp. Je 1-79]|uniref:hypothetical protein n=1 Tax=Streptomyces sp. Je 1-79 TaxID=2943847 RepID=UPI0021A7BD0D|nr:hypothetical protein [Streptomyces sp. Je 1-79]MCT4357419.1 hypothetical protein [Streptomyces sp. Je 1-79]